PPLRECLQIRAPKLPDDWRRFFRQSLLGASLAGQQKYADAEPLLRAGYEGMKAHDQTIPAPERETRLAEALERPLHPYDACGKPEQAAAWRAKLPPPPTAPQPEGPPGPCRPPEKIL